MRCSMRRPPARRAISASESIATALRRFSYRFTTAQIAVLADLYATALEQLEPEAVPAVRKHMCDPTSEEARRDAAAALAVCERLSSEFLSLLVSAAAPGAWLPAAPRR